MGKQFNTRMDSQPWVTHEYLESCNEWDNAQNKAHKTRSAMDRFNANQTRNRTTALKKQLEQIFFQHSIQEASGDSAKLFKALKRLWKNNKSKNEIVSLNDKQIPLK